MSQWDARLKPFFFGLGVGTMLMAFGFAAQIHWRKPKKRILKRPKARVSAVKKAPTAPSQKPVAKKAPTTPGAKPVAKSGKAAPRGKLKTKSSTKGKADEKHEADEVGLLDSDGSSSDDDCTDVSAEISMHETEVAALDRRFWPGSDGKNGDCVGVAMNGSWTTHNIAMYLSPPERSLPLVLLAPHGGSVKRVGGMATRRRNYSGRRQSIQGDMGTKELAFSLRAALARMDPAGRGPHLVVCHLHRCLVDVNRNIEDGAQGDPAAEAAWAEYHTFAEMVSALMLKRHGYGLVVDLHGHSHARGWVELGYCVGKSTLNRPGEISLSPEEQRKFSLGSSASDDEHNIEALLRGEKSLGAMLDASLQSRGFDVDVVPSPAVMRPGCDGFFSGGESVRRHAYPRVGINAVQIESPRSLRVASAREPYAEALAEALLTFLDSKSKDDRDSEEADKDSNLDTD